ncbi:MAG: SMP-30/gluconolactonase/LRE family protein [Chloroflexi bacterium]|nr:SMP-30/gluconolactonase/LRE family protein [Chloroflexota bacterium]
MRIEDDSGISGLLIGEETRLCGGFGFIEGPIWIASDQALVFSDIPGNRQHIWRPGDEEAAIYREPSGWSNGLTLDADGNLLACEHGGRRVSSAAYGSPGSETSLADTWEGKQLNSPNDLVVHSSGAIFFTDPIYGMDSGRTPRFGQEGQTQELDFQGVYRIDPDGSLHCVASTGFSNPNGLAFNPDESQLYIGDSQEGLIWRYEVNADLTLGDRILFVDQSNDDRRGAPDGMKVDSDGRLWTTGAGGVSAHAADGTYLGVFEMDEHAANLTFGGDDFSTLFMTAGTSLFSIETAVRGIVPGSR